MQGDPDWEPWVLQGYRPDSCGGHLYMHSNGQHTDMRRLAEKAHRSTRKFQVLHHHESGAQCVDTCEVYGTEVPRLG